MVQRQDVSLFELQPDKDLLENHTDHMPTSRYVFVGRVGTGNNADDSDACDEQSNESSKISSGRRSHCGTRSCGMADSEIGRQRLERSVETTARKVEDEE